MRVIRGFPGEGIVACFNETPGGGNPKDINSPRNAPAKSPLLHRDRIAFHSDYFQYELAMPMQTITVTLPAIPVKVTRFEPARYLFDTPPNIFVEVFGDGQTGAAPMFNHGLGYAPLAMVSYAGRMVVGGAIAQVGNVGTRRRIAAYASSSTIGVSWSGDSSNVPLPAVDLTFQVMVFRTPAANPALALFSGGPTQFQLARGKMNSASQYLRYRLPAESPFDFDIGRTVDLSNGGARIVTGGVVQDDITYAGSFGGSAFVPVGP